jgi:UDPglucose 6-dehydrogenase
LGKLKISVIGTGYVGLGTAVGFATRGFSVFASDSDPQKVTKINQGIPPFHEPDLPQMLKETIRSGNFNVQFDTEKKINAMMSHLFQLATPIQADGSIDFNT